MSEIIERCDHKSVGILVFEKDNLLLIERGRAPFGFAPPAGHVDSRSSFEIAAKEELKEEVGLEAITLELLIEGRKNNPCRRPGGNYHEWKIYRATTKGVIKRSLEETKRARCFTHGEILSLVDRTHQRLSGKISGAEWVKSPGLEPVWIEWFQQLGIIEK